MRLYFNISLKDYFSFPVKGMLIIVFILFCTGFSDLKAQDIKKDMRMMKEFYQNAEHLSAFIDLKIYKGSANTLVTSKSSLVVKDGKDFYYELDNNKMLISPIALIMVNEKEKDIIYRAIEKEEYEAYVQKQFTYNLDSIINRYESVKFIGIKNEEKQYSFEQKNSLITKVNFSIDENTGALTSVSYWYNKDVYKEMIKADIVFKTTNAVEKIERIDQYLIQKGKEYTLSPTYSHYHLINARYEE